MKLNIDRSNFKDDMGKWRTQALFYEYHINQECAVFTLKDDHLTVDGKTYYSMRKLYLEISDPTEYDFAITVLGSWPHWLRMKKYFLKDHVKVWADELEMKLRSEGILQNIKAAQNGNYNAAKWLADKGWEVQRGRPTKEEKEGRLKKEAAFDKAVEADMERIGLVAIK
jgi:hypothetical protein